jgi:aldehyde oxidoreductase
MKNVTLTVNGIRRQVSVEPDKVLLDLLREDLGLTGTKQSCDRKGQCGACTVIVNGKTALSCLKKVADLEGADVITVEGLGTPDNPHLIQEAYVLSGAIQCGFCTPGMIMATKALLDQNPNPTKDDIKKALSRNLCRCTGYVKIFDAVNLAARFIRGETTPEKVKKSIKQEAMGVSHPRPTGLLKACGLAKFTGDIKLKNAVEIAVVRSTEHHALIKSVDTEAAKKMPGVVGIMTASDIKGTNRIRVVVPDQPMLCDERVRYYGDAIVAVAAETKAQADAAAKAIKVEYEPLPAMLTPKEALAPGAYQIHPHAPNLALSQPLVKGDVDKGFAEAAAIIEQEFSTQINHQAPLEPEAGIAYFEGEGENEELVVVGRSIAIHSHKMQIEEAIGYKKVRYIEAFSGGQFGQKLAITSEAIVAAAALHFRRTARYIPSLHESMLMSSKRHPYWIKLKLGADKDGHITAYDVDFTIGKGAYFLYGGGPMGRAVHMIAGSYNMPNIKCLAKVSYTTNAYGGAARGAGPPQTAFALEVAIDMLAEKLNMDPLEFRLLNSLKPEQAKATGTIVKEWPLPELCKIIKPHYDRAKKEAAAFNATGGKLRRGVGIACYAFGIGMAGDQAKLTLEIDKDNVLTIYAAVADPGEGNDSMLTQIAAKVLDWAS